MKKIITLLFMLLLVFSLIACKRETNNLDVFSEEKEQLFNEILKLKELISEKERELTIFKENNSDKTNKLGVLSKSLEMVRWSSIARIIDYNDTFYNLENIYKVNSEYAIEDDWFVINDDYFQIELLGYENAIKVDFYTYRLESDQGPILAFSDMDSTDGWVYTNDKIGELIDKHKKTISGGLSFEPYFLIYAEATLADGKIIETSRLPIYNK